MEKKPNAGDGDRSESGAPIYRHEAREREFELAPGDSENIERISGHIEEYMGPVSSVFHELISDLVHIDIHVVAPTEDRNYYTLVTSGMSDRAMSAPEGYEEFCYSEVLIALPPDWPMTEEDLKEEQHYWPIRLLKRMARFPHEYETWLWSSHTVPNGDPAKPYADGTELCGVVLLPPIRVQPDFCELTIDNDKTIYFHALIPLHHDEMELKLAKGVDALFDGFDRAEVSEILDPTRPSSVRKKKSWRFWRKH